MEEKKFTFTFTEEEAVQIELLLFNKMEDLYQASEEARREYQHQSLRAQAQEVEALANNFFAQRLEQKHK